MKKTPNKLPNMVAKLSFIEFDEVVFTDVKPNTIMIVYNLESFKIAVVTCALHSIGIWFPLSTPCTCYCGRSSEHQS